MKKPLLIFLFILPFLSCQQETASSSLFSKYLPPDAAIVLKSQDLKGFSKAISENSLFGKTDFPMRSVIKKELSGLHNLNANDENLLCFSIIGRDVVFTFITQNKPDLLSSDFLNKLEESFQYDGQTIKKYNSENSVLYATVLDNIFIGSDSKLIVENVIRLYNLGLEQNQAFEKIYGAANGKASLFIQNENFKSFYRHFFPEGNTSFLKDFTNWTDLDISLEENSINFNGILSPNPESKNSLSLFKGLQPQKTELTQICPLNATGFFSFGYDDYSILKENLRLYRKKSSSGKLESLFAKANEIGVIYFPEGKAVALNSSNVEKTESSLLTFRKKVDEFRGNPIYSFSEKDAFSSAFSPLITSNKLKFYARLDHFFIFSENRKILENIIANHQNGSVVSQQKYYDEIRKNLTDESSIFILGNNENLKKYLAKISNGDLEKEIGSFNLNNYKLSALQLVHDEGFTHINITVEKAFEVAEHSGAAQLLSIELENALVGNPQFFEYWRTGEQNIVAQDNRNILYLYDNLGKLLWKMPLDGKIVGKIKPVDLYKNTRLQMAFVTSKKFYVLGIDGKDVSPFPLKFDSPITQPLAIFDYAGSRDYRFLVVQDNIVSMWDNQAKRVMGFQFNKSNSSVAESPKHFRIGSKDYIVIPEISGKLNILDRQGTNRVSVKKSFHFSENQWFLYQEKFTSTNADGDLVQVGEKGNVSVKKLGLSKNHQIWIDSAVLASIPENILTIDGKNVELDYGMYSVPKIFHLNNKIYVSITDSQAHKVYLFNADGKLLPGFPVYGNSTIDMRNMDNKGKLEFVVKGEEDSILVYGF